LNHYKSGFVTLLGRPNVGKSTLLNKLIGEKVTITSPIAQTTRNKLRGILTTQDSQIIFIDTPGIHKPQHLLGQTLVNNAKSAINGVDLILLIFDSSHKPGRGDNYIKEFLKSNKSKIMVVLNKWDLVNPKERLTRINQYKEMVNDSSINFHALSAVEGDGCKELINIIKNFLPIGPLLYPKDSKCDLPIVTILSELVREQVLLNTREEIPHSVAVNIEKIIERENHKNVKAKKLTAILATIIVERKSQKGILIGKNGSMLKNIGKSARLNIKKLIEGPVYLELFVKVVPNWRKKQSKLIELGYEADI